MAVISPLGSAEQAAGRQHYWDGIRALLMWFGIPYHASLIYRAQPEWSVSLDTKSPSIVFIGQMLSTFRMPCFFIVAGFFSALILARTDTRIWVKNRLVRLLVPFATAAVLVNGFQISLTHLDEFVTGAISYQEYVSRTSYDYTHLGDHWVRHLWFLLALSCYSVAMISVKPMIDRFVAKFKSDKLLPNNKYLLSVLCIVLLICYILFVKSVIRLSSHAHLDITLHGFLPWYDTAINAPFFLMGYMLVQSKRWSVIFFSKSTVLDLFGLAFALVSALTATFNPDSRVILLLSDCVSAFLVSRLVIYLFKTHFKKESLWVRKIVDASFTIYLVHQPMVAIAAIFFITLSVPAFVSYILIVFIVTGLSFYFHQLVAKSDLAVFLFNGVSRSKRSSSNLHGATGR